MTIAALRDDVDATIAMWIWQEPTVTATAVWRRLGNPPGTRPRVTWNTVRIYMIGWLARAEARSLPRVG